MINLCTCCRFLFISDDDLAVSFFAIDGFFMVWSGLGQSLGLSR